MVLEQCIILILFGKYFQQFGSKNECVNKISKYSSSMRHMIYDYPMEPPYGGLWVFIRMRSIFFKRHFKQEHVE